MNDSTLHAFRVLVAGVVLIGIGVVLSELQLRSVGHAPGFAGIVCIGYAGMLFGASPIFQYRPRLMIAALILLSICAPAAIVALVVALDVAPLPIEHADFLVGPLAFSMPMLLGWVIHFEPVPARHRLLVPLEKLCRRHIQACRNWAPVAIPVVGAAWISVSWEVFEQPVVLARGVQWWQVLSDFVGISAAAIGLIASKRRRQSPATRVLNYS